jgi:hypothetical protein
MWSTHIHDMVASAGVLLAFSVTPVYFLQQPTVDAMYAALVVPRLEQAQQFIAHLTATYVAYAVTPHSS